MSEAISNRGGHRILGWVEEVTSFDQNLFSGITFGVTVAEPRQVQLTVPYTLWC